MVGLLRMALRTNSRSFLFGKHMTNQGIDSATFTQEFMVDSVKSAVSKSGFDPMQRQYSAAPENKQPVLNKDGSLSYVNMTIGDRIKYIRELRGITWNVLSRSSGLLVPNIANIERNRIRSTAKKPTNLICQPSMNSTEALARALNISQDWILTGAGAPVVFVAPSVRTDELLNAFGNMNDAQRDVFLTMGKIISAGTPVVADAAPVAIVFKKPVGLMTRAWNFIAGNNKNQNSMSA